jgi:hypothetical protein
VSVAAIAAVVFVGAATIAAVFVGAAAAAAVFVGAAAGAGVAVASVPQAVSNMLIPVRAASPLCFMFFMEKPFLH